VATKLSDSDGAVVPSVRVPVSAHTTRRLARVPSAGPTPQSVGDMKYSVPLLAVS